MPWLEDAPKTCVHPDRPTPTAADNGKVWECPTCGGQWSVELLDMGHDVMPGEPAYQPWWRTERLVTQRRDS